MATLSPMIPLATGVERTSLIEVFGFQRFADLRQIAHTFIARGILLGGV
jgi:pyruvate dehydrogenase complex dehydrogenase (E1) component